ncbi:hypothetical protein Vau01_016360 [Virgisporangium aurantiacum]|uniref:Uncharacterized protein n=1 Tax=Virgisporangium aurantiacum TaxID=175570 RepID=A0A8J3Z2H4_9ACTN|nr:hypothetical protein Vau01_016360 [Virgisporangium aurantiacum]
MRVMVVALVAAVAAIVPASAAHAGVMGPHRISNAPANSTFYSYRWTNLRDGYDAHIFFNF